MFSKEIIKQIMYTLPWWTSLLCTVRESKGTESVAVVDIGVTCHVSCVTGHFTTWQIIFLNQLSVLLYAHVKRICVSVCGMLEIAYKIQFSDDLSIFWLMIIVAIDVLQDMAKICKYRGFNNLELWTMTISLLVSPGHYQFSSDIKFFKTF